jgi:hypothetical protein
MQPPLMWHIFQIIVDFLFRIVTICVLNHSCGNWLLNDVLHSTISLILKLKKITKFHLFLKLNGKECGVVDNLTLLTSNIRNDVCGVQNYFLSIILKYEKKKT